ncbi:uncharacterized protein LOC113464700 [Ceratina calcarata]|uniref:Uncharacterized protein LOC113464700 n=1 Tax=Ceratina calcarata TaxID=156304 RepID=A0AAJ7WD46_9HYME|nr:uncharacterized protein LOC113464700 [Ceratina calcarata]
MSLSVKQRLSRRSIVNGKVTRLAYKVETNQNLLLEDLMDLKNSLVEFQKQYEEHQTDIELQDETTDYSTERALFENQCFDISRAINRRLRAINDNTPIHMSRDLQSLSTTFVKSTNAHLPKIRIKPFDGNLTEWHTFHDTFKSLIHDNEELPSVQKFHFLKNALQGEAASVVLSLSNYQVAWDLLIAKYDRPRQIIRAHLNTLLKLQECTRDTPSVLRTLAEQALTHVNAFKALKQPVEHWDAFLEHILYQKLDKVTRRAWERTLENDTIPKFQELVDFVFKQARGDEFDNESSKTKNTHQSDARKKTSTQGQAHSFVATNNKSNSCIVCQDKAMKKELPIDQSQNLETELEAETSQKLESNSLSKTFTVVTNAEVLLGTAKIIVVDNFGSSCRALLDAGSQTHFVTKELAKDLRLKEHYINLSFSCLEQLTTSAKQMVNLKFGSNDRKFMTKDTFVVLDSITGILLAHGIDANAINLPRDLKLADPDFNKPGKIDILLGNTIFYRLLESGKVYLNKGLIILQNTQLVISLENQLSKFWEIEQLPKKVFYSNDELACEEHYALNTRRESDGRYIVRLPFNDKQHSLGESRSLALKRFYSLERRLEREPELKIQYRAFLKEYEQLGHMKQTINEIQNEGFYLPHHAVLKLDSATTKLRVVFDASARSTSGFSLNDILLTGPTIQNTLFNIILRFRTHQYVFTADIEKMFRQIKVHSDDTKYQKILWRDSIDESVKAFNLETVTYGTACAPFLAVRTLKQLATDEEHLFPRAAKIFTRDFYVDDLLTGTSDFEDALQLRNELISLASKGGFNLRQWASNDNRLLEDLQPSSEQKILFLDSKDIKKTLSVQWIPYTDKIVYVLKPFENSYSCSKRTVLSKIAQLFDPLGLLGPVIIRAKIIMQQLWKINLE